MISLTASIKNPKFIARLTFIESDHDLIPHPARKI